MDATKLVPTAVCLFTEGRISCTECLALLLRKALAP